MTGRRRACELCLASFPFNHANGMVVNYLAEGKKDFSILLHKLRSRLVEAIHPLDSDTNPASSLS
jgi:hypothetical protein